MSVIRPNAIGPRPARAQASFQGIPDSRLIQSFVSTSDQDAFGELVRRHAELVLGVCRRVLGNAADAEDAFQATFLVLALKAGSLRDADLLANWLHGVALRTARQARMLALRRATQQRRFMRLLRTQKRAAADDADCRLMIDEIVARLPQKYRAVVVLCYLEGKSKAEAAKELGWADGTVSSRLNQARVLLRRRLKSAGKLVGAAALAEFLVRQAGALVVPESLIGSTLKITASVAEAAAAGAVPAKPVVLAKGVIKAMLVTKASIATVSIVVTAACIVSAAAVGHHATVVQNRAAIASAVPTQSVDMSAQPAVQNSGSTASEQAPISRPTRSSAAAVPVHIDDPSGQPIRLAAQPRDVQVCSDRIRKIMVAILLYTADHDQHFPPDLGATLPYILHQNGPRGEVTKAALTYLSPVDQNSVRMPDKLTPEWVKQNTSFVYLADGRTVTRGILHAYEVVLLHEKLTGGHEGTVATGYCDGHACPMPRAQAEKDIEHSKRVFENSRD